MQEQMEQQIKQLQHGVLAAFGQGERLTTPLLQTNEVLLDGFTQCLEDQLAFGRACLDIGRKQMQGATERTDYFSLLGGPNAVADYCAAASQYGEALRSNAQHMGKQMASISRDAVAGGSDAAPHQTAQPAAIATQQPAAAPTQTASRTTTRKAAPKTAAKPARKASTKAKNKTTSEASAKKAQKTAAKQTSPAPSAPATRATPATDTANKAKTSGRSPAQAQPGSSNSKASADVADSTKQTTGKVSQKPSKEA